MCIFVARMSVKYEEICFEEDWAFYIKKRMKKLGLGLVLLIIPPIMLYFMFFYLLRWSSLFEKETGQILIFLILSPLFGFYLAFKALATPRIRIYGDRITNPSIFGKRYIPLNDIARVTVVFSLKEPLKVELHLNKYADSTRNKQLVLGRFLESDRAKMMKFFNKSGVKTGLRSAGYDEE
jgi:hypothetical protein